jgi:hypothetical protein
VVSLMIHTHTFCIHNDDMSNRKIAWSGLTGAVSSCLNCGWPFNETEPAQFP